MANEILLFYNILETKMKMLFCCILAILGTCSVPMFGQARVMISPTIGDFDTIDLGQSTVLQFAVRTLINDIRNVEITLENDAQNSFVFIGGTTDSTYVLDIQNNVGAGGFAVRFSGLKRGSTSGRLRVNVDGVFDYSVVIRGSVRARTGLIVPSPQTITFYDVPVGQSAVQTFVLKNTSANPVVVLKANSVTNQVSAFEVTPSPFITIPANADATFTVTYSANAEESISDRWLFVGEGSGISDTTFVNFQAINTPDTTATVDVDAGTVAQPLYVDEVGETATGYFTITNGSNRTTGYMIRFADGSPFALVDYDLTTTPSLAPGDTDTIGVIFTAPDSLLHVADVTVISSNSGIAGIVQLVGSIRPRRQVQMLVQNLTGKPGETKDLVVTNSTSIPADVVSSVVTLEFNSSMLVPQFPVRSDEVRNGVRTVVAEVQVNNRDIGGEFTRLPFVIAMGDMVAAPIKITRVAWFASTGAQLNIETSVVNGTTSVDDERTVLTSTNGMVLRLQPNPASNEVFASVANPSGEVTYQLLSVTGDELYRFSNSQQSGNQAVFNLQSFVAGTYVVRASQGVSTTVQMLVVQR
jgi:hypothetical protein